MEGSRMERPAVSGRLRRRRSVRNELTQAARSFRKVPTVSERLLWQQLRRNQLQGYTFRRQHPIGPFIVDFCCPQKNVIVEIDGPVHAGQGAADAERQSRLEAQGYTIVRLTADEVETRMADALHRIAENIHPRND
jgi:very-short-patch-repair endonuclease